MGSRGSGSGKSSGGAIGNKFLNSLKDYELRNIDNHTYLGNFGTAYEQKKFMKEMGVSDEDIAKMDALFDAHRVNGSSDAEIVAHIKAGDSVGKAIEIQIQMEEALFNRYIKKHPDADERVFRKGSRKSGVEPWTTNEDGAFGTGFDHKSTVRQLRKQGYRILGGMGRHLGSPGESEITFIKYKR